MTQPARRQPFVLSLLLSAMLLSGQALAGVSDQDILQDPEEPGAGRHQRPRRSGSALQPAGHPQRRQRQGAAPVWAFSFGGEKQRGQEAQPIIHDGTMYVTGSYSRLFARRCAHRQEALAVRRPPARWHHPCCDVVNRGAAMYGDMVIFGTLDAQLVALNKDTGKVVWNKKIDDYKAGYSITAAPLIVNGKLITGISGGEFGVVGAVEARDPKTGELVWTRPTVEGHMGYATRTARPENGISGGEPARPGRATCGRPAAPPPGSAAPTTRKPTCCSSAPATRRPGTATCAPATTSTPRRAWRSTRTTADQVALPDHAARRLGLRRRQRVRAVRLKKDGKRQGGGQGRPQRLLLRDRPHQRQAHQRLPVRQRRSPGPSGIDLKTGRPIYIDANRPGDPTGRRRQEGQFGLRRAGASSAARTGCRWPTARDTELFYVPANEWGMDIWNEPIAYKKGAAYLGAGFTIKPLFDDYIGALRAIDPKTGKIVWESRTTRRCGAAC